MIRSLLYGSNLSLTLPFIGSFIILGITIFISRRLEWMRKCQEHQGIKNDIRQLQSQIQGAIAYLQQRQTELTRFDSTNGLCPSACLAAIMRGAYGPVACSCSLGQCQRSNSEEKKPYPSQTSSSRCSENVELGGTLHDENFAGVDAEGTVDDDEKFTTTSANNNSTAEVKQGASTFIRRALPSGKKHQLEDVSTVPWLDEVSPGLGEIIAHQTAPEDKHPVSLEKDGEVEVEEDFWYDANLAAIQGNNPQKKGTSIVEQKVITVEQIPAYTGKDGQSPKHAAHASSTSKSATIEENMKPAKPRAQKVLAEDTRNTAAGNRGGENGNDVTRSEPALQSPQSDLAVDSNATAISKLTVQGVDHESSRPTFERSDVLPRATVFDEASTNNDSIVTRKNPSMMQSAIATKKFVHNVRPAPVDGAAQPAGPSTFQNPPSRHSIPRPAVQAPKPQQPAPATGGLGHSRYATTQPSAQGTSTLTTPTPPLNTNTHSKTNTLCRRTCHTPVPLSQRTSHHRGYRACTHCTHHSADFKRHKTECRKWPLTCQLCQQPFPREALEAHQSACRARREVRVCEHCGETVGDIKAHLKEVCLRAPRVTCLHCGEEVPKVRLGGHLKGECPVLGEERVVVKSGDGRGNEREGSEWGG